MPKDRIETELSADSTQLRAEFSKAQAKVRKFTSGVKAAVTSIGGLAAGAIGLRTGASIFGELLDKFDRVGKLANRFDLPTEVVQKLAVASELSGSSLEKLVSALTKATVAGVEASQGLETYKRAFQQLNIDVDEFNKAPADQKLSILARAFNEAEDSSSGFTAAYRILGKSGADLIPLLRENADGIERLTDNLKTLSDEDVQSIQDFNDGMTLLKSNLQADLGSVLTSELGGVQETIESVGETMSGAIRFVIEYREVIGRLVLAIGAYKGIKFSLTVGREALVVAQVAKAFVAKTLATTADTAAVNANTAAHLANGKSRLGRGKVGGKTGGAVGAALQTAFLIPEGAVKSSGKTTGKLFGKTMGKVAAANASVAMAGGIAGSLTIVAASAALGHAAGNALADAMGDAANKKLRDITAPLQDVLRITQQLVNEARTQKETDVARARIKSEIKRLTEEELAGANSQKRAEVEHTIAVLKQRDTMADTLRIRNVQRESEDKITAQKRIQLGHALHVQKVNEEALTQARERLVKERQIAAALHEQINKVRSDVVDTQVDLLPSEARVKIFTEKLKRQLKDADFSFNSLREDTQKEPINNAEGLFRAAQKAQNEGSLQLAKSLLERLQKIQETQAQITRATEETKQTQETQKNEAQELSDTLDQRLGKERELARQAREKQQAQQQSKRAIAEELTVLRLQLQGRRVESVELQKAIEIRKEAKRITEQTGVSEQQALAIAQQKVALQRAANRQQNKNSSNPDEGLKERLQRERKERIQKQRTERAVRHAASKGDGVALSRAVVRQRQQEQRLAPHRRSERSLEKFDRIIGQNDEILTVWKNLIPSS